MWFASIASATIAAASTPPHLVVMVLDDVGFADVGYHGSDFPTPVIDRLAASEGVRLENYYVQQVCSPTRSALMTGRYPFRIGMQQVTTLLPGTTAAIPLDVPTIAEKLQQRGYRTHAVGKWHLGYARWKNTPTGRGFETYQGYLQGAVDYYTKEVGLSTIDNDLPGVSKITTGFDYWVDKSAMWEESNGTGHAHYETDVQHNELQRIFDGHNASEPLFLYLAHQNIHEPLQLPPQQKYSDNCAHVLPSASGKDRHVLCAMANRMDDTIADLEIQLKENGMWDNTVLWVTTDNGGMLPPGVGGGKGGSASSNFPLRGGKATLFQGGVRGVSFVTGGFVPEAARGSIVDGLLQHVDVPTTMAALAGVNISNTADGFNVWNVLVAGEASPRQEVPLNVDNSEIAKLFGAVSGHCCGGSILNTEEFNGLIQGKWKLISGWAGVYDGWSTNDPYTLVPPNDTQTFQKVDGHKVWLFDLSADPEERQNLAAARPDIVRSMQQRLQDLADEKHGYVEPQTNLPHARSLPIFHNGSWAPFLRDDEIVSSEEHRFELLGYAGDNQYAFLGSSNDMAVAV